MYSQITTGAIYGISSCLIRVETDISDGLPSFNMVGFMSGEMREAGERVRVALKNFGVRLPPQRITINLAPAGIYKKGIVLDLPVCIGILICMGVLPKDCAEGTLIAGELGLQGDILPVRGILSSVRMAAESGLHTCVIPAANLAEGAVVAGVKVIGVSTLYELVKYLAATGPRRDLLIAPASTDVESLLRQATPSRYPDFASVHGHSEAKRILEIAAAGRHNVLLMGPPGTGKSMLASCLPGIMPPLTARECLEITSIYSAAGKLPPGDPLVLHRPFLHVHHTVTGSALAGGGLVPVPGLVTLAHLGVLFLDEMPEMRRDVLERLRMPLEDKMIAIARQGITFRFPSNFLLVGAMNLCPCGGLPDKAACRCTPWEIERYRSRISGPLLDRIDMQSMVGRIDAEKLQEEVLSVPARETSASVRERVSAASQRQHFRFREDGILANGDMDAGLTEKYCRLGRTEKSFMRSIYEKLSLSARGYHRILRVARTIADLADSEDIRLEHLQEASAYRMRRRYE